jgi:muconolactone delta-isomerase
MNAFTEIGARQISAPVKARQRAAAKRREKAKEKALAERDDLLRLWKRWRHERLEALLAGPYGESVRELLAFLQTMSLDDGPQLIEFVSAGDWHRTDPDTRFEILSLINTALTTLREQHGLPPFDDALPDEEPTAFLIIRELFRER